jgi:hypothetical protein
MVWDSNTKNLAFYGGAQFETDPDSDSDPDFDADEIQAPIFHYFLHAIALAGACNCLALPLFSCYLCLIYFVA